MAHTSRRPRGDDTDLARLSAAAQLLLARSRPRAPEAYAKLGGRILSIAEPLLAHDVLSVGLEHHPGNVRIRQLLALSLARSGATERAQGILLTLYREGHADGETVGLLARTHKDLWVLEADPARRRSHLEKAHRLYREGYSRAMASRGADRVGDAVYNGINAAATAFFLDRERIARELARRVVQCCEGQSRPRGGLWIEASRGEAALILGAREQAAIHYCRARELARRSYADLSTMRRQARMILEHRGEDPHWLDRCFRIPTVIVFSGHMVDRPGRRTPRFPPFLEAEVRREIHAALSGVGEAIGFSSAVFAALAAAQRARGLVCDYVGRVPLARGHGTFPTYHVRRGGPPESLR